MIKKLTPRQVLIKDCNYSNQDFLALYRIFRLTICPMMSEEAFKKYYLSDGFVYIDVSFYYASPEKMAGFCAAVFYRRMVNGKRVTIARSATGFLEEVRGGAVNKYALYGKYMVYKFNHFFENMILTIYALNPVVYNMVCKYTGIVYPRTGKAVPARILKLKNDILHSSNLTHRERDPFVVRIDFDVEKNNQLRQQASESTNVNVRFFVKKTSMEPQTALLLIIPVSLRNILLCLYLFFKYYSAAKLGRFQKKMPAKLNEEKNRLNCSLNQSAEAGYANRKAM